MLIISVWRQVLWALTHAPTPSRPGKEQCWYMQDSRQHRSGCTNSAVGQQRGWVREAAWDCAASGVALWHYKQQRWLTNQFSDMRVVKLLHTCSLSQELLNVSRGEDVSWKKVTISFLPRDFTDNDYQKLVLCGTAHPLRPTATWASLQQSRAWHFLLGWAAASTLLCLSMTESSKVLELRFLK